nr:hypothetical protein [Tanacetum cinerariifolium]
MIFDGMTQNVNNKVPKFFIYPSDSTPRVTSLAADEGSMQQQLNELTYLCTCLQRQQTEMASKFAARDLEISQLKARVKLLEDRDGGGYGYGGGGGRIHDDSFCNEDSVEDSNGGGIAQSREDAPIKGRSLDEGEEAPVERSTERGSDDTEEMVTVLTSLDVTSILTNGVSVSISPVTEVFVVEVPTGSNSIPTASPLGTGVPTGSGMAPTASPIFTTATESIPYTRGKGKEKMVESDTPKKKKLQEHIDIQVAREMEEQMVREDQRRNEHIERDAEIARIYAEEELHMMIDGLDRNNETIVKYL